jgi:hypothetical protein
VANCLYCDKCEIEVDRLRKLCLVIWKIEVEKWKNRGEIENRDV